MFWSSIFVTCQTCYEHLSIQVSSFCFFSLRGQIHSMLSTFLFSSNCGCWFRCWISISHGDCTRSLMAKEDASRSVWDSSSLSRYQHLCLKKQLRNLLSESCFYWIIYRFSFWMKSLLILTFSQEPTFWHF